jgi:hypothetical protein
MPYDAACRNAPRRHGRVRLFIASRRTRPGFHFFIQQDYFSSLHPQPDPAFSRHDFVIY